MKDKKARPLARAGIVGTMLTLAAISASAQQITRIDAPQSRVPQGNQATVLLEFKTDKSPWCGVSVSWGDGNEQDLRIGDDDKKTSPLALTHIYRATGKFTVVAKGKSLVRGLKSATACEVSAQPIQLTVFDQIAEQAARQRELESQQAAERQRATQAQAEMERRELELRQRDLANKALELKRKELEIKEAELRSREEEARRAERERASAKPVAPPPPPPSRVAAPRTDRPQDASGSTKGPAKSAEGF